MTRVGIVVLALLALAGGAAAQGRKAPAAESNAPAQPGAEAPVVAVVDVQHILREASAAKLIREAVDARRAAFEKELEKEAQELRRADEELRKQQSLLAPEAFAQRKRELERRYGEVRRRTDERRGALSQAYNAAMRQVRQEMARALAEVMKEREIDISMSRTAVLIFDERLDVTSDVLVRLNKRLPKVQVSFDQPPTAAPPPQN